MTFLATLIIFIAFFVFCGIGYLIAKKNFRGCACMANPHDPEASTGGCCKSETTCEENTPETSKESQTKNVKSA